MLTSYVRPQDTITQILQQPAAPAVTRRNPLVIGPQFELYLKDGRDVSAAERTFKAAGETALVFKNTAGVALDLTRRTPVAGSAHLYGRDLEALVAEASSGLFTLHSTDVGFRRLKIGTDLLAVGHSSGNLNAIFGGRDMRIGDVVKVTSSANENTSTYYRRVTALIAATGGGYDGIVVDGPVVNSADYAIDDEPTLTEVLVFQRFTGVLSSVNFEVEAEPLTLGESEWAYGAALGLPAVSTGRDDGSGLGASSPPPETGFSPFANDRGKVYLSYKAVVIPSATESLIAIRQAQDITSLVGETKQDNWLGRGTLEAFNGSQSTLAYALRTAGDTVEDFAAALNKIRTTDRVYALAVMSDSVEVMQLVKDHCESSSNKFNKNFRRCYVGTDSPGEYVYWGALDDGTYRTGSLDAQIVTLDDAFRDAWQFTSKDVGSTITIGEASPAVIVEVLSPYEVLTDAPVDDNAPAASSIQLTAAGTPETNARFVAARSASLSSRRCINVWCDKPTVVTSRGEEVLQNKFIAAEIAGLRCALLPQQGLTMTEILSADSAPSMYARFTPELLDEVAANGVLIVAQESEGGSVFIRHQLTTDTGHGALAYEDSPGVVVDEFSYAVKDTFRNYIGRRNLTPETISEIDIKLKTLATSYTKVSLADKLIGPPVLAFYDEKGVQGEVTVRQDGVLADTLLTYVKLRVPLPINNINHYVDVEVSDVVASADN